MQPVVILYLLWVLWFLSWLAVAIVGDAGPHKVRGPFLLVYRLAILAATLLLFTLTPWPGLDVQYRFWDRELGEQTNWGLTAIAGVGFMFAWWATISRLVMGKRRDGVLHGPYRLLRYPVYLGLIVAVLASAAMFGRLSSATGAALFLALFLAKILVEEHSSRDAEPVGLAERVSMLLPIPKEHMAPKSDVSAQQVSEPRQPEPALILAKAPEPATESAPGPQAIPVQLRLSLDVAEKSSKSALTEADLKP